MIHNLFDEFRFFPKYPDKELQVTAHLFGALIHEQLIRTVDLASALHCVLQSLHQEPGSKMCNFALEAIRKFRTELPEWPKFCSQLLAVYPTTQYQVPIPIHARTHASPLPG